MSYDQFSAKVGEHLKVDSTHIRFSTINATSNKPKSIVKRLPSQNLFQILSPQFGSYNSTNQRSDALLYEVLDMTVSEMDTKKLLKVTWLSEGIQKEVCIGRWKLWSLWLMTCLGDLRRSRTKEWRCFRYFPWPSKESQSRRGHHTKHTGLRSSLWQSLQGTSRRL